MSNQITIGLEFSFRGETFTPSLRIGLNELVKRAHDETGLHDLLAHSMDLDAYTYQYDVLLMEPIEFSDASGVIAEHMQDGQPDIDALEQIWREQKMLEKIEPLAREILGSEHNIAEDARLRRLLCTAFEAGRRQGVSEQSKLLAG